LTSRALSLEQDEFLTVFTRCTGQHKSSRTKKSIATSQAMDEGEDDFLRLCGPPPYQIEERHLERIFANYKPRDITIGRLIDAPPWIERAGVDSRLYRLFWMNVPLIMPAEGSTDPPEEVTGPVSAELESLGVNKPIELAWDNAIEFIEKYFLDPSHNWLSEKNTIIFEIPLYWSFEDSIAIGQTTIPMIDDVHLWNLLNMYEELQCWDYPKRLTPLFIWKERRGNRLWSKQPNTKRNIRPELGISQPLHAILNEALNLWGRYLTGGVDVPLDTVEFENQLCTMIRGHIQYLYVPFPQKRGYVKYWMTHAFDAFSRPSMDMDTYRLSWTSLYDGTMIQPDPEFLKRDTDEPLRFDFEVHHEIRDMWDGMEQDLGGGDEDMEDMEGEDEEEDEEETD
jgi:hypothetical protein